MRSFVHTLAILLLVAAGARAALAESPEEARILQAGDNLIGWVGEATSVENLFAAIPAAQLIYAWDAEAGRYRFAAPGAPGDLEIIEPGMGLVIRIAGTVAVEWQQPMGADGEFVALRPGPNLVAWTGPDGTPLALAGRSAGSALELTYHRQSEAGGYQVFGRESRQAGQPLPELARGDGLWVVSTSEAEWLQPSGKRPLHLLQAPPAELEIHPYYEKYLDADGLVIISSGSASEEALFRAAALIDELLENRPDIRATLASLMRPIIIIGDSEQVDELPGYQIPSASYGYEEFELGAGPWWDPLAVLNEADLLCQWEEQAQDYDYALFFMAQVVDYGIMLQEGADEFTRSLLAAFDAGIESGLWEDPNATASTLAYWVYGVQTWFGLNYPRTFSQRFTNRVDLEQQAPELAELIHTVFGDVELSATCHTSSSRRDGPIRRQLVQGSVTHAGDVPTDEIAVSLSPIDATGHSELANGIVFPDGSFNLFARPGDYRLALQKRGCSIYYGSDGFATTYDAASALTVRDEDLELQIGIPEELCSIEIKGRIVAHDGAGIADLSIFAESELGLAKARTNERGEFSLLIPAPGEYTVAVSVRDCSYLLGSSGLALHGGERTVLNVGIDGIDGLDVTVPQYACELELSGRIIATESVARVAGYVLADDGGGPRGPIGWVELDGSFNVKIHLPGEYHLSGVLGRCRFWAGANGVATDPEQLVPFELHDSSLTGLEIELPPSVCRPE